MRQNSEVLEPIASVKMAIILHLDKGHIDLFIESVRMKLDWVF